MSKISISVVISAFNEEKKLQACLESLGFASEIVVVDNSSTDATVQIAKKFTKKVYERQNNPMLNVNKNYGFTKATGDWILSIDADERISPELTAEIQSVISLENDVAGYWIPRKNILFGKWIQNSIWWPDYQLRLFKKGYGKFPEKHVHEMIHVEGKTEKLQNPMTHENYDSISQFIYKLDKIYTENEAENFIKDGKDITPLDALRFPVNDFLKTFFAKKGYKDGLHGLVLSILQAFYAEIVFAKIWEKKGFFQYNDAHFLEEVQSESKKLGKEIHYWFLTSFIKDSSSIITKTYFKISRKFFSRN